MDWKLETREIISINSNSYIAVSNCFQIQQIATD